MTCGLSLVVLLSLMSTQAVAQGVVPGTGTKIKGTDDFEDENWTYISNWPKSSFNIDKQVRGPSGYSKNGKWTESTKRGAPDVVKRVATPPGGLPGSNGALKLRSLHTGVPGVTTTEQQQDDFLMNARNNIRGSISVSRSPSTVVRVYVPPFQEWEQASGASFGWRASVYGEGPLMKEDLEEEIAKRRGLLRLIRRRPIPKRKYRNYYPGFFIVFNSKTDPRNDRDSATLLIRGDNNMQDVKGPTITEPGWWTLGMSFTPDGRAHFYASPGVDNLTRDDYLYSAFPQSVHCQSLNTMFFNVVNRNDGTNWSTEWIVDDPEFYVTR